MNIKTAEFLVENACRDATVRERYSGRGMYGKETCGVVTDDAFQLVVDALQSAIKGFFDEDEAQELDFTNLRIDNMGLDWIIY